MDRVLVPLNPDVPKFSCGHFPVREASGRFQRPVVLVRSGSRKGKELFYSSTDVRFWVASYTVKGDSFAASQPRVWSERAPPLGGGTPDLMPDGKRFVVLLPPSAANTMERQTHVTFLLNFSDELRRRVPGR